MSVPRRRGAARHPSGHGHRRQEEVCVVVEGGGRVKPDDGIVDLRLRDGGGCRPA